MRDGWTETTIGDVAEASWGNTTVTKKQYKESGFIAFSASGPDGFVDWFEHDEKGVVLSAIGALCGKTWLAEGKWTPIKNTIWFKTKSKECLTDYLFLVSKTPDLWPIRGQAQPFISLGDVRLVELSMPPLAEQKRIVDVVSSVDAYIAALQQQADTARTARNAVAEKAINSGFPTFQLSQIGRIVTGSTPSTKRPEYWEPAEVDFITPGDFGEQLLISNASRRVSREGAKVSRALSSHSVLQVCIGATIGKVGYVSNDVVTNQQINSVVGLEELDAYFVSLMLSTNELQVNICDRAGTTTLPIISKSAWGELSIPWPDAQIRKGISLLAKSIDEYVLTTDKAVADAKNLRSGLLSDLLSGEHEIPKAYDQFLRAA
jgi:type I restriction enzyme S subunit